MKYLQHRARDDADVGLEMHQFEDAHSGNIQGTFGAHSGNVE